MKNAKLYGSALCVTAALLSIGSTGSASADTLCQINQSPCPPANTYGTPVLIHSRFAHIHIPTPFGTILCQLGLQHTIIGTPGTPMVGKAESLTAQECALKETACTITFEHLPYKATVAASGGGNGVLTDEEESNGIPQFAAKCGSLINCKLAAAKLPFSVTGGNPATMAATEVALEKAGGFLCPSSAKFTEEYKEIAEPAPLFVES